MSSREVIDKIRNLSTQEKRNLTYEALVKIIEPLTSDEIIELSNVIGYPVFTRLCMGVLKHRFVLLQDGAAAIIVNNEGQILLQSRADRDKWGLPGGCQELGERFQDTVLREVKEETGIELDNEVINDPFLKIIYLNKDYPNKGENRESDIYYYAVETNKLPDLENVNYTESEINKHFELINIDLNNAIDIIKENIPNHKDNEIISKDMIIALEEYGRK